MTTKLHIVRLATDILFRMNDKSELFQPLFTQVTENMAPVRYVTLVFYFKYAEL